MDISKAIDKAAGVEREILGPSPFASRRPNPRLPGTSIFNDDGYIEPAGGIPLTRPATDAAREWEGWHTALKPAWEPIILAMKPLEGTFAENARKHGVAGLNIDGARIETNQHPGVHKSFSNELHQGYQRPWRNGAPPEYKPTPHGRWPANLLLDEEAAALLDAQSGESKSAGGRIGKKAQSTVANVPAGRYQKGDPGFGDSGGAARFFYIAKADRRERQGDLGEANPHPTVKPLALMKYLCLLTQTPTGGVILDPFAGSGTTLVAAKELGRPCMGIDQDEASCQIAANRLRQEVLPLTP